MGYYIAVSILISTMCRTGLGKSISALCGGAIFVSMFASIYSMLIGGNSGAVAQKVSTWCLRGTVITTGVLIISEIGIDKIVKAFAG